MTARAAAIDIGTNSTRLLVADGEPSGASELVPVERLMRITRLGQGVDERGALAAAAVERTLKVLEEYRQVMDRWDVPAGAIRMTATSAARDASNRDDFFDRAEAVIGVRPELLSGDEEAHLSFTGATTGFDRSRAPFLVFDLGGGSTEFAYGTDEVEAAVSIDIGCVRLTERFIEHDPPQPEELLASISYTEAWLDDVDRGIPSSRDAATVIGLAGTVSTVVAVEIGLATYDRDRIHHFVLTRDAAEDVFRTLATEPRVDRIANPGLEEARADVIVGGCCALVAIMRHLGLDAIVHSESDILDGLVISTLSGTWSRPSPGKRP